jgi:ATP phosphoribosyltransferase
VVDKSAKITIILAAVQEKITLSLPKGRILKELSPILSKAGIIPESDFFDDESRKLQFASNDENLSIIRTRSFDTATFTAFGASDIGVCGSDVLAEFDYNNLYIPLGLGVGRCKLSIARLKATGKDPLASSFVRVATKYPSITHNYFAKKGVQVECIKLNGAIELAPKLGMCDFIVDLVSSGKTLEENGLEAIGDIMQIESMLIVNKTSFKHKTVMLNDLIARFEKCC